MNNPYIIRDRDSRLVNAYHIDKFIRNKRYQEYIYSNNGTKATSLSDNAKFWADIAVNLMNECDYKECMEIISSGWYYYNEHVYMKCTSSPLEYTAFEMILSEFILPCKSKAAEIKSCYT